jgi:hypothetical protein
LRNRISRDSGNVTVELGIARLSPAGRGAPVTRHGACAVVLLSVCVRTRSRGYELLCSAINKRDQVFSPLTIAKLLFVSCSALRCLCQEQLPESFLMFALGWDGTPWRALLLESKNV